MSNNFKDETGNQYGRLLVIKREGSGVPVKWLCVCDCGNRKAIAGTKLRNGHTKSCGCLSKEMTRTRSLTHGFSTSKMYRNWNSMRRRCSEPDNKSYPRYGGRGIRVCGEWEDFSIFKDWAFSHGYIEGLSLDRIDNNKGYSPENCHWIPFKEQSRNRRVVKIFDGMTAVEAAARLGGSEHLVHSRLYAGWDVEKAFTTPKHIKHD